MVLVLNAVLIRPYSLASKGSPTLPPAPGFGFQSEVSGFRGFLDSFGKPLPQSTQVSRVNVDAVIRELLHELAGDVQQNILVSEIIDIKLLRRIGKHDVVEIAMMKFVGDTPELGALSATSVPAEEVISVGRSRQSSPDAVDTECTTEPTQAVLAACTLGIHPSRVFIAVEVFVKL